ncbi:MAG: potassium transporter TrkA [Opitutaceae bacterium]|jgi:voltage-gated potassium channel|nr:potassium transporter TrkA [Opitutaceae bacterium]
MKAFPAVVASFLETRTSRTNLLALVKLLAVLFALVTIYSIGFHYLMALEGQEHTWMTGLYWTLTVMSTLGFGDITFHTDLGRGFSLIVLGTGVVFLLVLLPFTFIEFFYAPWMRAQAQGRAPRELPMGTKGHILLTQLGPITKYLIKLLTKHRHPYYIMAPTLVEAMELHDQNLPVVVGEFNDPETYRRLRVNDAAMVVTTRSDVVNTNVTFTARETAPDIPIVATSMTESSRDALELAGATRVLRLELMMGQALSRRVIDRDASAHLIGELDGLHIAEASVGGTSLVGKNIATSGLRDDAGVSVVGLWERGNFLPAGPETEIGGHTVLVLAGTPEQIERYNQKMAQTERGESRVVIVGSGRVGRATAEALDERKIEWKMVEKIEARVTDPEKAIIGDASELDVIVASGMRESSTVIITTHDDDLNIFLTILYRRLRPNIQIICRCTNELNVSTLHRAGADLVLSYASMAANSIFNELRSSDALLLAEGVNVFTVIVPPSLEDLTIAKSGVRSETGCTVIALEIDGRRNVNPPPETILEGKATMVLVGNLDAEEKFMNEFVRTSH